MFFLEKLKDFFGLSELGVKLLKYNFEKGKDEDLKHIRPWLLSFVNGNEMISPNYSQTGCGEYIPGLAARPVWRKGDLLQNELGFLEILRLMKVLEEKCDLIKAELQNNEHLNIFQPYTMPHEIEHQEVATGTWRVCYLSLHNADIGKNAQHFPVTMDILNRCNRLYPHCFFSVLENQAKIRPHHGPTNKKLRIHLPLLVPEEAKKCFLKVGAETVSFQYGKTILFDDSFLHSAINNTTSDRVCLIVDVYHPELSNQEVKLLRFLEKAKLRKDKRIAEQLPSDQNFFELIKENRASNASNMFNR
eukprot:snap_masked-scaffold_7-processed-gene-18.36-mRNA-1 protein AED:0.26 eAED:0.26 QI:0/-1/0/1/-1/1/1/0/303